MIAPSKTGDSVERTVVTQFQSSVRGMIKNIENKFGRAFVNHSEVKLRPKSNSKPKEPIFKVATTVQQTTTTNYKLHATAPQTNNTTVQTLLNSDGNLKRLSEASFLESKKILVRIKNN